MSSTFQSARNHPVFIAVLNALTINQFCREYNYPEHSISISEEDLKKSGWLASILASSDDERHQFIAASFAKLLYFHDPNSEQLTQLSYLILSRTGNLAAARHLKTVYAEDEYEDDDKDFKKSFGVALDLEIGAKRNLNRIEIEESTYFVTDFQRTLWEDLKKYNNIAISAPTSAGKSFFLQHFIQGLFATRSEFKVVYIVPSRALISQVSDTFKKILASEITIRTAYVDHTEMGVNEGVQLTTSKKEIYCVTPERMLKLLQQGWKSEFFPDLIFIDEIQNVETDDNRAVLLEYVLSEIPKLWIAAKILFAGPFISNGKQLYKKLLSISGEEVKTYLPPVYQLRLTIQNLKKGNIGIVIHLLDKNTHSIEINDLIEIDKIPTNRSLLAPIVQKFGKEDGNLIYSPTPEWCVEYAIEFIKELKKQEKKPTSVHPAVRDLMDLLKEEVHGNYYLIYCLRYGVGFHHGKLPDIVKNEIEYLFENGYIKYLFCTSTLLQGVNLPSRRMFIISPNKKSTPLSKFEFGNLIGRAGRIRDSMIGTIFCLEKNPEKNAWSLEYYNAPYTKEVITTSDKSLKKETKEILNTMKLKPGSLKHTGDEYTCNFIKHKFVENPDSFEDYLRGRELESDKITEISEEITKQLSASTIPIEVLRLNPSLDPVLQNALYELIKTEGIEKWVLIDDESGNQNFRSYMKREETEGLDYSELSFYFQFEFLLIRLDEIFAIWKEAYMMGIEMGARKMAYYGITWLDSLSLSQLIKRDLEYYASEIEKCTNAEERVQVINERINKVIGINSIIVTYILVKYFKILADILASLMSEADKQKYKRTLSLATSLELGTRKIEVMLMISMGIPRPLALKISKFVPDSHKEKPMDWLSSITQTRRLPIERFYIKYLIRRGYLSSLPQSEIDGYFKREEL